MKNKNTIRLTESELKTLIKETVKKIIKESYNSRTENYDIDLSGIYSFSPEVDNFFENNKCPDTVSVDIDFQAEPYNPGDRWTPPSGGEWYISEIEIDTDGIFKKIMPNNVYQHFINDVNEHIMKNMRTFIENLDTEDYDDSGDEAFQGIDR